MAAKVIVIILALGLVNFLPRVIPLTILSKMEIPPLVIRWLELVPAAVVAALLAPSILMPDQRLALNWDNLYLLAAIPTFVVATWRRSLSWTLLAGLVVMALLQAWH